MFVEEVPVEEVSWNAHRHVPVEEVVLYVKREYSYTLHYTFSFHVFMS